MEVALATRTPGKRRCASIRFLTAAEELLQPMRLLLIRVYLRSSAAHSVFSQLLTLTTGPIKDDPNA